MRNPRSLSKQKGIAMLVTLIMLLLMSLIVLHNARSSTLELLMGNNTQHAAQALMRAEDSVVAGENLIELNYTGAPTVDFSANQGDGLYVAGEIDMRKIDWSGIAAERVGAGYDYREYTIEYLGTGNAIGGSLSVGAGAASDKRFLYRISGRGESARGGARVVQTIFATAE